jgi:ATP:ADP antiporter, AAA family
MVARLRSFLDVRTGETMPLLVTFVYMAIAVGSFLLAKPIRNGLFLGSYGSSKLVYVYVLVPLVLSAVVPLYTTLVERHGERLVATASQLLLAASVFGFWWMLTFRPAPWLSGAFYVWVNCYGIIASVQAWTFASAVFDTRQARRLFGLVGSGASFGAVLGGLIASELVGMLGTINLLLVLAGLITIGAVVVNAGWHLRRADAQPPQRSGARPGPGGRGRVRLVDTLMTVARTPYLRNIALLVSLVAITTLWTQFLFQAGAERHFAGSADAMTRFFGRFNSALGVAALAIQIVATGPALRRFGLGITILLLPVLLTIGIAAIAVTASLWAVLMTSAFDQGLRFSIDKATFELLYLPIGPATKTQVKTTIDLVVNRLADGVGAVLLGVATTGFLVLPGAGLGLRGVAIVSLLLVAMWILLALALRRGYVVAIYDSIMQHRLDAERAAGTVLDRTATEALAARLRDGELVEVLYALEVFRMQHRGVVHPAVRGLLGYSAPEVRSQAILVLGEAGDRASAPDIEPLLADRDAGVRAEALLFLARHGDVDPLSRLSDVADFPEYSVQASIVAFLARESPWQNLDAARLMLRQMITARDGPDAMLTKIEAARILSQLRRGFDEELHALLQDGNAEVVRAALVAAGQRGDGAFVPSVLSKLEDGGLFEDAAQALGRMGDAAVADLRYALEDTTSPVTVRTGIPRILATIGGTAAREALVENLLASDMAVRAEVVAALGRLHAGDPELAMDRRAVEMVLTAEAVTHYRSYQILASLQPTFDQSDPVAQGLREAIGQERDRIVGLIAPLLSAGDASSVADALRSPDAGIRANALELADNVLSPELRRLVLPLVDAQVSAEERVVLAGKVVGATVKSQEEAVAAMLSSDNAWLKACGVYAAGALRLETLRPLIGPLVTAPDALLRETARATLQRLEAPAPTLESRRTAARAAAGAAYAPITASEAFGVG